MTQMNISLSPETAEKAKEHLKGRISAICEKALRIKLNLDINASEEERICNICHKPNKDMIWDGFMECWICPDCNVNEIRKVSILKRS